MSTIKANTLLHSDGSTTTQPSIPALDKRMAKAWVNFNGTGTVAINGAYNVSSISDNGTGNYTVNFTVTMANSNYVAAGSTDTNSAKLTARATGSCTVVLVDQNNTAEDRSYAGVTVMGG